MEAILRAKTVLDICAYELRNVSIGDQGTLEAAIAHEITDALRAQMREFNKTVINKARVQDEIQAKLIKVRKREKS